MVLVPSVRVIVPSDHVVVPVAVWVAPELMVQVTEDRLVSSLAVPLMVAELLDVA